MDICKESQTLIHDTKPKKHKIIPEILILQCHTDHYYMFRFARELYQGIQPKQ